jgi:predicted regulator of Ras-like GTPase activity (Roadblock/LC7/MglB family)
MGLYQSGKSTIKSVVFEGVDPKDFLNTAYKATINYHRDIKQFVGSEFQVFDLGGQENFLRDFTGEKAPFIFSDCKALIWVIDVNNVENVSVSKFYFDKAIKNLKEFSPDALVYCILHKADLIMPHLIEEVLGSIKEYFGIPEEINIEYHATSIFDQSVFQVFGEIMKKLLAATHTASTVSKLLLEFIGTTKEISGVTILTEEGLPVFEEGEMVDKIVIPANLWLSTSERLKEEFRTTEALKSTMETDDFVFVFQQLKDKLLLTGVARKVAPLQFVLLKMEQLTDQINTLL